VVHGLVCVKLVILQTPNAYLTFLQFPVPSLYLHPVAIYKVVQIFPGLICV